MRIDETLEEDLQAFVRVWRLGKDFQGLVRLLETLGEDS